jgi:hypothetical protein
VQQKSPLLFPIDGHRSNLTGGCAGKSGFHGFRAFSRLLAHKVVKMSVVEPIAIDHQEVSSLLESI